jgi:antitoxin component YwqK of YwqJK toxin-antitoxin module
MKDYRQFLKLLILFISLFTLNELLFCQNIVDFDSLETDILWKRALLNGKPFTGKSIHDLTALKWTYERYYENGEIKKVIKYFSETGKILEVENFDSLSRHGKYFEYSLDGQILKDYNYYYGKYDGIISEWYPNGQLFYSCRFSKGKKSGTEIIYYPNGQLESSRDYKIKNIPLYDLGNNGQYILKKVTPLQIDDGHWIKYDLKGNIIIEGYFIDSDLNGRWIINKPYYKESYFNKGELIKGDEISNYDIWDFFPSTLFKPRIEDVIKDSQKY